jgi:Dyp-type peroxidase family
VAGNDADAVRLVVEDLQRRLDSCTSNPLVVRPQFGNARRGKGQRGTEHFGFADGVSQPGIRGTWQGDVITPRQLNWRNWSDPEHDLFGHPGQHLVWPGEFVLGYPGASPDPRLPGPVRTVPAWMHNGSFLVCRRLQQHVEVFDREMARLASELRQQPGFARMTPARLKALLVGRWPSGAPLSRAPVQDSPALGRERLLNNDFRFDDAAPLRHLPTTVARRLRKLPPAPADPLGLVCPVGSHIRKLNLRDQASDVGGASATQSRRILRVGVPYDDTPIDEHGNPGKPDRGLLFLSIQASIEDQFEFLQARWINSRVRPRGPGGNDMIVGQCAAMPDRKRQCVIHGDGGAQALVETDKDFVTMTGGGYFFLPSLSTLRDLLQGTLPSN